MKHLKTKGVIIALSLTFLIACGGSKTKKPPASLSVAPQVSVRVGESKTVPVTAQNTDFTVSADKTGSGCARADDKSIVCTPTATGEYHLTLTATANKSITARLTVNVSEPLTLSVAPQVNARVGESKTVPVTTQNTDFTVSADKVGSGCARADDKSIVCSPTASGEYHLTLTATVDASITAGLTVNVPEIEIDSDEALELFADDTESNEIIFNAASEWTADVKNSNGSVPSWIGLSAASGHVASQFTVKSAAVRATSISVPTVPHITDRSPSISGEKGTNYITVVLDPNYSKVPRTAIITITTAKNGQKTITVTQLPTTKDGIVLGDAVTISISPPEANTLPGEKRTFSVTAVHTDFTFSVVPSTGHGCDRIADTIACTPTAEGAYEIKVTALNNPSKIDTANLIAAYEYVADANIRVNLSLLGAKRVSEVRFDAKPSGFSSPQILQQISLLGDGVLSLTVGDLRAAISAISPAGSEVKIGRGNVSATPTRLELADNESLSDYSAYLKSPTINGVIYLFVIPPGSSLTSTTGTLMYVVAEVPKYEYIADTNIRVNLSMLGEKGISDVKFDAKPGGFASVQILRQISFLGGGIETLTAGELKAAIEVISPAGSEIKLGKGNVSAAPGSTRVELLDSESLSNYSAYLKNPTVNGVIYLFVIPPGSLITSTSGTVMYVVAEIIPQTDEYITDAANSIRVNISMLGAKGITAKFDTKPSGFTNTQIRQQISLQGDNVATLTAGELKAAIEAISPAGSEIKLGKGNVYAAPGSTRVELQDNESLSNYSDNLENPTTGGVIYLFVIPPGSTLTSSTGTAMYVVARVYPAAPAPPITNGMLIAMASPVAGNTRAIVGDYIYKAGSGVPVLASAINPDTTYITYQTGVYRIKIDAGGNITDFWADYDVVDEGYIMRPVNTAAKTISLGINNPKAYGYNDDTKFFNLSTFAAVTKSAFETAFATEQIGYKYWAVDENKNGVLEALYYMPSSVVSAANRSALEKFKTVVPAGAMYSVQDPLSELKYAYYDPAKTAPGALVVFLPGSGAGYDV